MSLLTSMLSVPNLAFFDSYKASHTVQYPDAKRFVAHFTPRKPLNQEDRRIVVFGIRRFYDTVLSQRIKLEDIDLIDEYMEHHLAGGGRYEWPKELWKRAVLENDGYLPFTVRALEEGTVVYDGTPVLVIEGDRPYEKLIFWLEDLIDHIWSPMTTCTKSASVRDFLSDLFDLSVDDDQAWRLDYAFHDFGLRGTDRENAIAAGMGHLVCFDGTDNIPAGMWATKMNDGGHVGQSVYASEHSVMSAWPTEGDALQQLIDTTPTGGVLSVVADTRDYTNFHTNILPRYVDQIKAKNIWLVLRPDSGDPTACVLEGLASLAKSFGYTTNSKGFKVITGASVLQGDGIKIPVLKTIAAAAHAVGWSAQCIVYGMGGGLLQDQNRDTLGCAMKNCERTDLEGIVHPQGKNPKTDAKKISIAGNINVIRVNGVPTVYPKEAVWEDRLIKHDMLEVIYDRHPISYAFLRFGLVRKNFRENWAAMPPQGSPYSEQTLRKQAVFQAANSM